MIMYFAFEMCCLGQTAKLQISKVHIDQSLTVGGCIVRPVMTAKNLEVSFDKNMTLSSATY